MKTLILVLLLLIACPAWAAIAHDKTTVDINTAPSVSTCSFTHTPTGTPTLVLMFIGLDANETIDGPGCTNTCPTYGGTDMVLVAETNATGTNDEKVWLYELHSPAAGAQTVTANYSTNQSHWCSVTTYTGTHATDATVEVAEYDNSGGPCATADTTITLDATTSWMVTGAYWQGGDLDPLTETNYTIRTGIDGNDADDTTEGETGGGDSADDDSYSQGDSTGHSGSRTHTSDGASSDECAQISVELIPAAGVGADPKVISITFD